MNSIIYNDISHLFIGSKKQLNNFLKSMIKAAFFYDSALLGRDWNLDLDKLSLSGTDYLILELYSLLRVEKNVTILATSQPSNHVDGLVMVKSIEDAYDYCKYMSIPYIIINAKSDIETVNFLESQLVPQVKVILWCHNTPSKRVLSISYKNSNVYRLVMVSNAQKANISYHPVYNKTSVIFNFIGDRIIKHCSRLNVDFSGAASITYIGALTENKGFQHLAKVWSVINSKYPNIILNVCGSAKLYGENKELGKYGLAEGSFENFFLHPLGGTLEKAESLNIRFLGSLNKGDLFRVVKNSKIVVVNLNIKGSIETFCLSAAEAMLLNVPVLGGNAGGLIEVVGDKLGGLLVSNDNELIASLETLLENDSFAKELGKRGNERVLKYFNQKDTLLLWKRLINTELPHKDALTDVNLYNKWKVYLKKIIRILIPFEVLEYSLERRVK